MTVEELLRMCTNGLPKVSCSKKIRHSQSQVGKITVIKDSDSWKGCAVRFNGMDYDTWFHDSEATDKRSHYMRELTVLSESDYQTQNK